MLVLIHRHDAPLDDAEWRGFLAEHDFGEFIAPGAGRDLPVVVPAHFLWDGAGEVVLHLAKPNPVWDALEISLRSTMSEALLGQKPPKLALDELVRDWQRNLRRAGVGRS